MNREEKQTTIDELSRALSATSAVFAVDFHGVRVDEATKLRRKIRESGARYRVVKNTLALRALAGTRLTSLEAHFKGMTGLALTDADPVALARVLSDFAKEVRAFTYKGGVVSGKEVTPDQFKELASLPGREELLGRMLYVLQAPMRNLLGLFQAPARDLILVLKAAADRGSDRAQKEN